MLERLRKIFSRKKQKKIPFSYARIKGEVVFYFFSDIEMEEAQLSTAMDIILCNSNQGISGMTTACEVFEKAVPMKSGYIKIESKDEGKSWTIKIEK